MKQLILVAILILTVSCTTTNYKEALFDSTGKITTTREVSIKRPIFSATAVSWGGITGNINSASSVDLNQLIGAMIAGYMSSQMVTSSTTAPIGGK